MTQQSKNRQKEEAVQKAAQAVVNKLMQMNIINQELELRLVAGIIADQLMTYLPMSFLDGPVEGENIFTGRVARGS